MEGVLSDDTARGALAIKESMGKDAGHYSRPSAAMIQSWCATGSNPYAANHPSTPPSRFRELHSPDTTESPQSHDQALFSAVESDQITCSPSSSLCSTTKDSKATTSSKGVIRSNSPKSALLTVDIPECVLTSPKSCYEGFEPPDNLSIVSEWRAIQTLSPALSQAVYKHGKSSNEIRLDEFSIYLDNEKFPEEMRPLNHLNTKLGHSSFFFDGVLSIGDSKVYVRRVPVAAVPIDNYRSLSIHTVRDHICVQSRLGYSKALFYKLGKPAKEYARFFYPFLWVADLAKHFVDFLDNMGDNGRRVSIHHFRSMFANWAKKIHGKSPEFCEWLRQHPSDDYRTSIAANIGFLHKEALGVLGRCKADDHAIWAEILDFQLFKSHPTTKEPPTIVTQYIFDCFEHLPFGDRLQVIALSSETAKLRNHLIRQRHLELPSELHQSPKNLSTAAREQIRNIQPGDTISTHRDDVESGTLWKRELSKGFSDVDRWFAYVQAVHVDKKGMRTFDVIWYYRPVDTLCGLMKYPWNNELFLSDHCSCTERSKIDENEILGVHHVDFGGTSRTSAELFCRQTYLQGERRWVTLEKGHLQCEHTARRQKETIPPTYEPGKTYLLRLDSNSPLAEPCELVTSFKERGQRVYQFRRLLRRQQVDANAPDARPNELVYTEQIVKIKEKQILNQCSVRFFQDGEKIPTPYDRNGTGNLFYITHQQIVSNGTPSYVPLKKAPASLQQGYDPLQKVQKLRGIDLFCGGGNFGRGLEDGGGIEMKWANDFNSKAIHTYMANVSKRENVHPFLGSIDDLQRLAMEGQFADNVPCIGDVDFVAGGSPCPGFSLLTNDKTTAAQRKNQSLVAAFASFVDLYRPKYGVLENVPGMILNKKARDQDVFSQLVCALVGLGYQTQLLFLDASSCGSPQRRSRIFVVFAAPGLQLPKRPAQTHSHPPNTRELGIGWLPNGQHMATREMPEATPFKFVSAQESTSDLPSIYDAKPDICVAYPDHRMPGGLTKTLRSRISVIPNRPWGMDFAQAWYGDDKAKAGSGTMTASERGFFIGTHDGTGTSKQPMAAQPSSKAYGRMYPNKLFDTIVTRQTASDAKNGRLLHWRENRLITIMEARRAQGFRDEDVLLGDPITQYRIVGNSVAREVAVALGITFREAWVASLEKLGGVEVAEGVDRVVDNSPDVCEDEMNTSTSNSRSSSPTTRNTTPLASRDEVRVNGVFTRSGRRSVARKRLYEDTIVAEILQFQKRQKLGAV